jgi:hypothetical protein
MAMWAQTVGQYEQLVMAVGEGKVNCLDALLQAGLNHGLDVRGMMELLNHARKGLYKELHQRGDVPQVAFPLAGWCTCCKSGAANPQCSSAFDIMLWVNSKVNCYVAVTLCRVSYQV